MADDEWRMKENSNNWSSYNCNSGWNDQNQNQTINYNTEPTYITTTTRQQPPQSTQSRPNQKKDGFSSLFVAETSFPSWEDST